MMGTEILKMLWEPVNKKKSVENSDPIVWNFRQFFFAGKLVLSLCSPPALSSYEPPADDEPLPVPGGQEEEVLQLARLSHPPPAPQILALCAFF